MAPAAGAGDKGTTSLAQSRKLHQGEINRGGSAGSNQRRNLTPEQKQLIRELYAAGKNGYEVARELGIGKSAVYRHLELCRRPSPTWTDDEIQVLVDGYLEKRPVKEIAAKVGRTPRAVMVRMCRYRKQVRGDPKKRRVLGVMTYILKVMRKSDIFRELER